MDTIHAFAYGDHIHVLAYRRHDEPTMEPDPELENLTSCAAEAVERTFARIEERRRQRALVAKRNRQDRRIWRQTKPVERGPALLDYNTALDIDWRWSQENPVVAEHNTGVTAFAMRHDPRFDQTSSILERETRSDRLAQTIPMQYRSKEI